MPKTLHNSSRQTPEYYNEVLRILIDCNAEALTYSAMATVLNDRHITTPTGLFWQEGHIRQLLKKVRNYKLYPSFIHQHLMQLIFEGTLTMKETLPLFKSRVHGIK